MAHTKDIEIGVVEKQRNKYRPWVIALGSILVISWFALGIYLHVQAAQSRAKVERNRIEAQRKMEVMRRESQYKQDWQQRTHTGVRNVFDGR